MHCSASCLVTRSIAPVARQAGIAQGTVRGVASFAHEAPVSRCRVHDQGARVKFDKGINHQRQANEPLSKKLSVISENLASRGTEASAEVQVSSK